MKSIFCSTAVLVSIFAFAGCGPLSTKITTQRNAEPSANGPTSAKSPSELLTTSPTNTAENPQNDGQGDQLARNSVVNRRKMINLPEHAGSPLPPPVAAAENSTITTAMAIDGTVTETRVFTGDRDVDRVRKVSKEQNETAVIFLKNGRSITTPAGKIPSLRTISLTELRSIAGISTRNQKTPNERREKGSMKPRH